MRAKRRQKYYPIFYTPAIQEELSHPLLHQNELIILLIIASIWCLLLAKSMRRSWRLRRVARTADATLLVKTVKPSRVRQSDDVYN